MLKHMHAELDACCCTSSFLRLQYFSVLYSYMTENATRHMKIQKVNLRFPSAITKNFSLMALIYTLSLKGFIYFIQLFLLCFSQNLNEVVIAESMLKGIVIQRHLFGQLF